MSLNSTFPKCSVFIADDDPSILQVLAIAFKTFGHSVVIASNGQRALELVEHGTYGLYVLDILMPGATGWEVLARALELTPPGSPLPRCIMITGFNQEYVLDMDLLRREGASGMLLKPFGAKELLDEAARVLAEPARFSLPKVPEKTQPL